MDLDEDMEMLKPVVAQMISPNEPLPQYEMSQLDIALRQVWYHARGQGRLEPPRLSWRLFGLS
jgi:hypothetical protein